AGAGIYYGNDCSHNMSLRVPGPALSYNQSCTFAIWMAIKECPRDRPLIVYTTSEFVANALTRYAPSNAKNKWSCANGDLLRSITMRIREREAMLHIALIHPSHVNKHREAAESLAAEGA
ncbi:hypothetical protein BT96DRAFT_764215, partial [Gymnopus androsaceus JB14]